MKKLTINQIRQEVQFRLNHLKKILQSCETWDQLGTVDNYHYELGRQINHIFYINQPFFGFSKYTDEMILLTKYFDNEYQKEYDLASDRIFNRVVKP